MEYNLTFKSIYEKCFNNWHTKRKIKGCLIAEKVSFESVQNLNMRDVAENLIHWLETAAIYSLNVFKLNIFSIFDLECLISANYVYKNILC